MANPRVVGMNYGYPRESSVRNNRENSESSVKITPLGAGQEVGRSCILIEYRDKTVVVTFDLPHIFFIFILYLCIHNANILAQNVLQLDMGLHPAHKGTASLPFLDSIPDITKVDLLLVTHFHIDHAACLPYFLEKTEFKGPCYMTHPTKAIFNLITMDFIKVSAYATSSSNHGSKNKDKKDSKSGDKKDSKGDKGSADKNNSNARGSGMSGTSGSKNKGKDGQGGADAGGGGDQEEMLYDEEDLKNCLKKIRTINYHQDMTVNGIKFRAYHAGHVLGAAMFMIEIADIKILYTGDYSCDNDRHLRGADKITEKCDILIIESTFGVQTLRPIRDRERMFTQHIHEIVQRGGKVLIPVFALGRAQELLLIIDEYWENHPNLQHVPIYYASQLAKKCLQIYNTYMNMLNPNIQQQMNLRNESPFDFKHVQAWTQHSLGGSGRGGRGNANFGDSRNQGGRKGGNRSNDRGDNTPKVCDIFHLEFFVFVSYRVGLLSNYI